MIFSTKDLFHQHELQGHDIRTFVCTVPYAITILQFLLKVKGFISSNVEENKEHIIAIVTTMLSLRSSQTLPKYLVEEPSSLKTVTTPGRSTCKVGTWAGRMPKAPVSVGTSTCFTLASLKNT